MKLADSPEIAVRFGSARVRTTPALSIARNVACTDGVPAVIVLVGSVLFAVKDWKC